MRRVYPNDIDEVAIVRRLDGDTSIRLNNREAREAYERAKHRDLSNSVMGKLIGRSARQIQRYKA